MILDMNGNLKEIPMKNTKNKKLTSEKLTLELRNLLENNVDGFFVFYAKDGLNRTIESCTSSQIGELIDRLNDIKTRATIYECLDDYFCEDYILECEEDIEILKQQELIEEFIKAITFNTNNDDDEDK